MHLGGVRLGPALAWACAGLPLLAAHGAYLISAAQALVPWCNPYWDGCTSVSRAARHGEANVFFKLLMLAYAPLLALFWVKVSAVLRESHPGFRRRRGAVLMAGWIGTAFMVLYTIFLGVEGDLYQWLRRFGITFFFGLTVLAQMLLASLLLKSPALGRGHRRGLLAMCGAMLLLGLASIPLQHLAADRDAAVNALEWSYAFLMVLFFPLAAAALNAGRGR